MLNVPGIGPTKVKRLLNTEEKGQFNKVEDLKQVRGIGGKLSRNLKITLLHKLNGRIFNINYNRYIFLRS